MCDEMNGGPLADLARQLLEDELRKEWMDDVRDAYRHAQARPEPIYPADAGRGLDDARYYGRRLCD